jgi:hypothetical protein
MVTDAQRRGLYDELTRMHGSGHADTMMELWPPVEWSDVARRGDIAELRGEIAELRGQVAELRGEIHGEVGGLRGEMRAHLARLIAANIASMIGIAGLVYAIASRA